MADKQIKLIVTDLDGTLLDQNKKVCQENYEALKAAYDRGVKIALCSGRPPHDASIIALDAGLDMYILFKQTHTLNREEMSQLIDGTVYEAQALNIETLPPDELARMMNRYKEGV